MKYLLGLTLSLLCFQAHAVDTSGCSPLQAQNQSVKTVNGLTLTVTAYKPNSASCWNANQASLRVDYEWMQKNNSQNTHKISHWMRLNNNSFYIGANVTCHQQNSNGMQANTSGDTLYRCTATTTVSIANMKSVDVEVAPQVDGTFDTAGYGQNYHFNF
jgi:hypothetical protein